MATPPSSSFFFYIIFLLFISISISIADSHFEGFDADDDPELDDSTIILQSHRRSPPPPTTLTTTPDPPNPQSDPNPTPNPTTSTSSFEYWDEDEFEGFPTQNPLPESTHESDPTDSASPDPDQNPRVSETNRSYLVEIICGSFLIMFTVNYFTGRKANERLALVWATKFATQDTIFDKNFSLLGVGDGDDSPLLLKEGQNVFKFYASGRRFCQGLVASMELKSQQDLIARVYNMVVPCKDEITFEVYMNDDAMDHVVFALAKKKAAKVMQKEVRDLHRFASLMMSVPSGRKWVADELAVITESKEVAGDLINETVLDQVFGEKAYEKYGKWFISMHFSDQHQSTHRKMLVFKFALPDANHIADMTRLVALVPYYIDLIGRYKLSSQARSKTEAARSKVAQEVYKELQNARQEALQRKKAERRKMMEEAESKLNAEALRKKEAKERARQLKKAMPKVKMSRGA
ncbi:uncharacterized protein At5g49945-like [Bidens hawaiensis]|uniref:uncharacterized protein At5g49945-like n=1 Tax=Bidens hawaiensis TaxID=980011 RepID=UPI00404A93F7